MQLPRVMSTPRQLKCTAPVARQGFFIYAIISTNMMTIILLGILGVVISILVGICWYSTKTPMGKLHLESLGFSNVSKEEQEKKMREIKPKLWKYYVGQIILSFLTSTFIAYIMLEQRMFGIGSAAIYVEVGAIWLCFNVPIVGQTLLWGNCDLKLRWKKFFSDIFANLVTYMLIIFIFSLIYAAL